MGLQTPALRLPCWGASGPSPEPQLLQLLNGHNKQGLLAQGCVSTKQDGLCTMLIQCSRNVNIHDDLIFEPFCE